MNLPNINPLAPPWLWPSCVFFDTPAGFRDDYWEYNFRQSLTPGQTVTFRRQFDGDACFVWRNVKCFLDPVPNGVSRPYIHIQDHNNRFLSPEPIDLETWIGVSDVTVAIVPVMQIPPGVEWTFTLTEITGTGTTEVNFSMRGVKRKRIS